MTEEDLRRIRVVLITIAGALTLMATAITLYLEFKS